MRWVSKAGGLGDAILSILFLNIMQVLATREKL
jgi:hypothetical protein